MGHTNETFEVQDIKLQERPKVMSQESIQNVKKKKKKTPWTVSQTADLLPRDTLLVSLPSAAQADLKGYFTFFLSAIFGRQLS